MQFRRIIFFSIALVILATLLAASFVYAQEGEKKAENSFLVYEEPKAMPKLELGTLIIQTALSLLGVIVLVYLTVWGLKLMLGKKEKGVSKERLLNILERNYLEPKKALFVVRALDRILILGITAGEIRLLTEITDKEVFNKVVSGDFYGYLKKYTSVEDKKSS